MTLPIDNFNLHIKEIKKLHEIFSYTSNISTKEIDISGILRAEIVFAVSALDQYIHSFFIDPPSH